MYVCINLIYFSLNYEDIIKVLQKIEFLNKFFEYIARHEVKILKKSTKTQQVYSRDMYFHFILIDIHYLTTVPYASEVPKFCDAIQDKEFSEQS